MRKLRLFGTPMFTVIWVLAVVSLAVAKEDGNGSRFRTSLIGYQEVPAVSTGATGSLTLDVRSNPDRIDYALTYTALEGGVVTAAHIHLGQRSVNGGVIAFFCGGGGRPACTTPSGSFSGTITPADILGPTGAQQVTPGAFDEVVRALKAGVVYANVHSTVSPGGEIRGQVTDRRGDNDHDNDNDNED
jgi:CHRD domain-containing protein